MIKAKSSGEEGDGRNKPWKSEYPIDKKRTFRWIRSRRNEDSHFFVRERNLQKFNFTINSRRAALIPSESFFFPTRAYNVGEERGCRVQHAGV